MRDLCSGTRLSAQEQKTIQDKVIHELNQTKQVAEHIRTNVNKVNREQKNTSGEIREMRTSSLSTDGTATVKGGSLLGALDISLSNGFHSVLEAMGRTTARLQSAIEAGVDPEKSFKRKAEELEVRQQEEQQKAEEGGPSSTKAPGIPPTTGEMMMLKESENAQMMRDLADLPASSTPTVGFTAPPTGLPPMAGVGSHPIPHPGAPATGPGTGPVLGGPPPIPPLLPMGCPRLARGVSTTPATPTGPFAYAQPGYPSKGPQWMVKKGIVAQPWSKQMVTWIWLEIEDYDWDNFPWERKSLKALSSLIRLCGKRLEKGWGFCLAGFFGFVLGVRDWISTRKGVLNQHVVHWIMIESHLCFVSLRRVCPFAVKERAKCCLIYALAHSVSKNFRPELRLHSQLIWLRRCLTILFKQLLKSLIESRVVHETTFIGMSGNVSLTKYPKWCAWSLTSSNL